MYHVMNFFTATSSTTMFSFFNLLRHCQTPNNCEEKMRSPRRGCVSAAFFVALTSSFSQSSAWTTGVSSCTSHRSLHSRLFFSTADDDGSADERLATFLVPGRPRPTREYKPKRTAKRQTIRQSSAIAKAAQRRELLNHELLTREEELDLGRMVNQAGKLRSSISQLVEGKKAVLQQEIIKQVYNIDEGGVINESLLHSSFEEFRDFSSDSEKALFDPDGSPTLCGDEISLENYNQNQMELGIHSSLDDMELLSDDDIISGLGLKGGRAELQRILLEGAFARDKLIRSNMRLVVSIAKRWARQSARYNNQDGARLVTIYAGSTFRPSLDDAIQEGIVGLARAADKYDPSRGLRFSTYSSYWVTNFVRNCFQDATTGSLRVPSQLHLVRSHYKTLLKKYYETKTEIPPEETIAAELGISVKRLRTALRSTQQLLSIDGPFMAVPVKGSNAGSDGMGGNELWIADTLQCSEARPEDHVELSFLRQCLENAMSAELSPHERDVLRLRLGLDDGVTRSVREVVEVCGGTVSVSEVRLTEQRAFKKLRAPFSLQNYQLIDFLDFAGIDQSSLKR